MGAGQWIALGGLVIASLGAVVGVVRFLVQAPLQARSVALEAQVDRLKGEVEAQKERNRELSSQYEGVPRDFVNLKSGKGGVLLRHEVEAEMELTMKVLAATESSVLVPAPFLKPPGFVFLTVRGPAGPRLRTVAVPLDKGLVGDAPMSSAPGPLPSRCIEFASTATDSPGPCLERAAASLAVRFPRASSQSRPSGRCSAPC